MKMVVVVAAALAALAGCKKDNFGKDCQPLKVTLAGTEIPGLVHGVGYKEGKGHTVLMANHPGVTCEDVMANMRTIAPGEESIIAMVGGEWGSGVSYRANTQLGSLKTKLVQKPEKEGDPIGICVRGSYELMVGKDEGKKLTVDGLFTGKFCGEKKKDQ